MNEITLQNLDNLIKSKTKGLFYNDLNYYCSCGNMVSDLITLLAHLVKSHVDINPIKWASFGQILDKFEAAFNIELDDAILEDVKVVEDVIVLPEELLCICVSEHELGLTSDRVQCSHCTEIFSSMDLMTEHRLKRHNYSQKIIGENIFFEKPDKIPFHQSELRDAYFCPQPSCKYNLANPEHKYFSSFKLLKQHYTKIHAEKSFQCFSCNENFALQSQLKSHMLTCGVKHFCETCNNSYKQYESLQTHSRRTGHKIPRIKPEKSPKFVKDVNTPVTRTPIPIVPTPSKNHIQAALALSELSSFLVCRADIGIQTDHTIESSRSSPVKSHTPDRANKSKVTSATQTKQLASALKRKYPVRVNSEVQTQGEYLIKPKRDKKAQKTSQGSQCRMSPVKSIFSKETEQQKKNEMTTQTNDLTSFGLSVDIGTDIGTDWMEWSQLWPLVRNTNGTQTSPRVMQRKLSEDSIDSLPDLEAAVSTVNSMDLHNVTSNHTVQLVNTQVDMANRSSHSHNRVPNIDLTERMGEAGINVEAAANATVAAMQLDDESPHLISNPNTLLAYHEPSTSAIVSIPCSSTTCTSLPLFASSASSSIQFGQSVTSQLSFTTSESAVSNSMPSLGVSSSTQVGLTFSEVSDSVQSSSGMRHDDVFIMRKKFGEVRQFSTETQTDLDQCQENLTWTFEDDDLELPGAEKLLNKMETQETQTAHEDLLLCTNTCTQTGDDNAKRFATLPVSGVFTETRRQCNTESQTSLTGLVQPQYQIVTPDSSSVETADAQLMTDAHL